MWNYEARTPSWISQWLHQWVSATNLCSKIGTTGREHGYSESRRKQVRLKEELSMKEKVLWDTQIRSMHELGGMKRAQELRVGEVSVQKLKRKSWDDTKAHFSVARNARTDELYEWLRRISNYSGRLSYVSSQPAMIPSSSSMLSLYKRLPLDTWNTSGLQGNVFGNQFSTFDSLRHHPQGIQSGAPQRERESVPQATGLETLFARDDKQSRDTLPMPTFARRPSTVSSIIHVEFPHNCMVGQQRANFGIAIRQIP